MKIYVAEQYHDNPCGFFLNLETALEHYKTCIECSCIEEKEGDDELVFSGKFWASSSESDKSYRRDDKYIFHKAERGE